MTYNVLIIYDGKISSLNQATGLINSLKKKSRRKFEIKFLKFNPFYKNLVGNSIIFYHLFLKFLIFKNKLNYLNTELIVSCGRVAAPLSLVYKRICQAKIINILDPYFRRKEFDKIIIPNHDKKLNGNNFLYINGSLINRELRNIEKSDVDKFSNLINQSKKNIVILVGGNSKRTKFKYEDLNKFALHLQMINPSNNNLFFLFSRRTSHHIKTFIKNNFKNAFIWDENSKNPYWFLLNKANFIIVTEDSISMISEAISLRKPVYIFKLQKIKEKNRNFTKFLENKKIVKSFSGSINLWRPEKLIVEEKIIPHILEYLKI
tara:strand:+ start:173 stop:1129 length:957 start_codon:yes stop_codon:yes gene_type:complete